MTMEPTPREKKFIQAAYKVAPGKADFFQIADLGKGLGYTAEQSHDLARVLERDWALVRRLENNKTTLTDKGRLYALKLADDAKAERRKKVLTVLKWVWGTVVTLVLAYVTPRVKNLAERADHPSPPPSATTAPSPAPASEPTTRP